MGRQKWTSDLESGIIYCFWLCSCVCHKRIWMDYLFQIHIFHPRPTAHPEKIYLFLWHRQLHNQKQYMIPDSKSDVHFCLRRSVFKLGQPPILRKYIFFCVRQLKNMEEWLTQDEIYGSGTNNPSKFFCGTDNYTTKSSR